MRIWPWSEIQRLRARVEELGNRCSALERGSNHLRRVLESIPEEVAVEGQRKVEAYYREQGRKMAQSVWP